MMGGVAPLRKAKHYPKMPPLLEGETLEMYTDRLTGADHTGRVPYDHVRNRACSIGYHRECTDPQGERCKCPCHSERSDAPQTPQRPSTEEEE